MNTDRPHSYSSLRRPLIRWSFLFLSFNFLILLVLCARYAGFVLPLEDTIASIYFPVALIGHSASLVVAVYLLLFLPLILILPRRMFVFGVGILAGTISMLLLLIDYGVYCQYRFHLNGMVFNFIFKGGSEIFSFSWVTWLVGISVLAGIFFVQTAAAWILWKKKALNKRFVWAISILFAVSILVVNFAHAWADAISYRPVISITRHIPLFKPLTAKRFLERHGLINLSEKYKQSQFKIPKKRNKDIDYPLHALRCVKKDAPLNVVFVVIDSWRFDMLTAQVTPNIHRFLSNKPHLDFKNHMSAANGTRIGIFNLFYGVLGTYWDTMEDEGIGPVMIKEMLAQDYQMGIFASAKLTMPPFNRTVFHDVKALRAYSKGDHSWERDQNIVDDWMQWIAHRDETKPFLGLLFFDSAHAFETPPDYPPAFQPAWKRVDYHLLNNDFDPRPFINRYKNSIHYIDSLVNDVLSSLEQQNLLDKTIIILTGDHGKEFNENKQNYWGHGSNYTKYQIQVPFVIYWPGKEGAVYTHATSHLDAVPTIMKDVLGCTNPSSDYSNGKYIFNRDTHDWLLVGGFSSHAIVEPDRITVAFPTGHFAVYDTSYQELKTAKLRVNVVKEVMDAMAKFYSK